jgi:dienelactone hydrolase
MQEAQASPPSPAPSPARARWRALETFAIFVAALLPLVLVGSFPTYDGPQHIFAGWLLNHIDDQGTPFADVLALQVAYSALYCPVVVSFAEHLMPLEWAARAPLALTIVLQVWALLRLMRLGGGGRRPLRWLAAFLPWNYTLYMGFLNFFGALGFGFLVVSLLAELVERGPELGRRRRRERWLLLSGALLLTALSHAFAAILTGLVCGVFLLGYGERRALPGRLLRLGLASLPTLGVAALVATAASEHQSDSLTSIFAFDLGTVAAIPSNLFESPYGRLWPATIAFFAAAGLAVVAAVRRRLARGFALALLAIVGVAGMFPNEIPAWSQLAVRFTPFMALFAFAGAATLRLRAPSLRWGAGLAALGVAGVTLVQVGTVNAHLAEMEREFRSGIGQVESGPYRLFVRNGAAYTSHPDRHMASNLHVFYMIEESAVYPMLFRNRREQHVIRETEGWAQHLALPFPELVLHTLPVPQRYQAQGRAGLGFDELLLWAPEPGQLEELERLGYRVAFRNGRIVRLLPPERRLEVTALSDRPRPLFVEVHYGDLLWPQPSARLEVAEPGVLGVLLEDLPATSLEVRLFEATGGEPVLIERREVDTARGDGAVRFDLRASPSPATSPGSEATTAPPSTDTGALDALAHEASRARASTPRWAADTSSPAAFGAWREGALPALRALLGLEEGAGTGAIEGSDSDLRVLADEIDGEIRWLAVDYIVETGLRVRAHLVLPRDPMGRLPGLVLLHGHDLAGIDVFAPPPGSDDPAQRGRPHYREAQRLAAEGRVVLVPEVRSLGLSGGRDPANHERWVNVARLAGREPLGLLVRDAGRALSVLAAHPNVDGDRLAVAGFSLGGEIALLLAATDSRVHEAIIHGFLGTFAAGHAEGAHCVCQYVPGLLESFDIADLAALVAPTPLRFMVGTADTTYPIADARAAFARLAAAYAAAGVPDAVTLVEHDGGHHWAR